MKVKTVFLLLCILLLSSSITGGKICNELHKSEEKQIIKPKKVKINETEKFLFHIGFKESTNSYKAVNKYGFLGKYQFSLKTIHYLGFDVTRSEFLSSPELQEKVMVAYLLHNKKMLVKCIEEYSSTVRDGTLITESGILAAAHLGGATGVKRFLRENQDSSDRFGTKISNYLEEFSGYNLEF